jgi:hypothetical protein
MGEHGGSESVYNSNYHADIADSCNYFDLLACL